MYAISREGRLVPPFLFQEQLCFVSYHIKISQTDSTGITNTVQAAVLPAFPFHSTVTAVIDFLQGLRHFLEINIAGTVPYVLTLHDVGETDLVLDMDAVERSDNVKTKSCSFSSRYKAPSKTPASM